jgi:hypothetical protein
VFVGHLGVALAAKQAAPRASLGALVAAAILLDLAWPVLVLAGVEIVRVDPGNTAFTPLDFVHYPFTHGAVAVALWSIASGAAYRRVTGDGRGAAVVGGLVASHWVLDLVTHRPDLPLALGEPKVGLGLWNSVPGTLAVELAIFFAGVALYARATRAADRAGAVALWALVGFLLAVHAANALGPPPPSGTAVAVGALAQLLFVPWGAYVDRHRTGRAAAGAAADVTA